MNITEYIRALDAKFTGGSATEHSYRPALEGLLEEAAKPNFLVTNEPKQIPCGMPDFMVARGGVPAGWVEAKDLDKDLDDESHKEQIERYAGALNNLIVTNYLEFRLLIDGKRVAGARIGEVRDGRVVALPENARAFAELLTAFANYRGITVLTADSLADHMAARARMLAAVIADSLAQDEARGGKNSELQDQLRAFRAYLIHDTTPANFAGIYAQTIAYGMFTARLHDDIPGAFNRIKAAQLIPVVNPFLRKFFQHIAGYDLDKRIRWTVDALAGLFEAADVGALMKEYGTATRRNDPFLHFYETFLGAYDPAQRKRLGVYYTPEPVVDFIVRAVDDILRGDFQLGDGLGATDMTTIEVEAPGEQIACNKLTIKKEVHKVQILDPAAGTGTFLATIVRHIHENQFTRTQQQGLWPDYAREYLIPRLHGFEIQMAPYVMAHTKLEMVLRETGIEAGGERLRIFLTNALEEHTSGANTVFAQWLSEEANEASGIKRDTPVMVVIGNPPYLGESENKGEWIRGLLENYKKEPGGEEKLKERNSKWINDDYVKFIRYGQHHIDRAGEGVLAYISNHGFLDNPTFRGMRWNLLQSFDKIYIVDLHGNAKQKGTAPDGSKDVNVFDIMQGVSINLFVKTGEKSAGAPARVFHFDLYGERENKYAFLYAHSLAQVQFAELTPSAPQYFFVPKDHAMQAEYEKGFSVNNLFEMSGAGITTAHDDFVIGKNADKLIQKFEKFKNSPRDAAFLHREFNVQKKEGWDILLGYDNLQNAGAIGGFVRPVAYRPFDNRHVFYEPKLVWRTVEKIMHHFLAGENVGLITTRRARHGGEWKEIFVTDKISNSATSISALDTNHCFPLYLYPETIHEEWNGKPAREPNLDKTIVAKIAAVTGMRFTPEKETDGKPGGKKTFAPIDLLDYIYAVLHAPSYRARYNEFLKIDFPRVPYPADAARFWQLAKLGGTLRALHLMDAGEKLITTYPVSGDNTVTTRIGRDDYKITDRQNRLGRVHINARQYFGNVPESAWHFFIGGYQPAQKYLKDRRGRRLSGDDIGHYQKIIAALSETEKVMAEIDKAGVVW
ncbi:MAG: N-6 DNA methylase [Gammaproteobacteria bacterium]